MPYLALVVDLPHFYALSTCFPTREGPLLHRHLNLPLYVHLRRWFASSFWE
jgi:hypothetical protein